MIGRQFTGSQAPTSLQKTKWTAEEDNQLRRAVQCCGAESWTRVAMLVPTRTGKQCRERWIGQLSPALLKDGWLPDEDAVLVQAHAVNGNRWTAISLQLPGRSPLCVKNRWNWLIRHGGLQGNDASGSGSDVVERPKRAQPIFDLLTLDDGLFGTDFEQFRARMLTNRL
jgi:hypothetical protein